MAKVPLLIDLLEYTNTISKRDQQAQILDDMDLRA
jgi:translation elongation factor EF-4